MENEFSLNLLSKYLYSHLNQCNICKDSFFSGNNFCFVCFDFMTPYYEKNNCYSLQKAINANVVPQSILDDIREFSIRNL
jgi:hypothetical protein